MSPSLPSFPAIGCADTWLLHRGNYIVQVWEARQGTSPWHAQAIDAGNLTACELNNTSSSLAY